MQIEEKQQEDTDEQRHYSQGSHNGTRFGTRIPGAVYRS
jgi:hypothetical protein